jgi:alcohol dehydrogenase class IV
MAQAMNLPVAGLDETAAASAFVNALKQLNIDLGIPDHLKSLNIQEQDLEGLVEGASKVTRLLDNNPRAMTRDDMHKIYAALI